MTARIYQSEFKSLLEGIYRKDAYFSDFFGGEIEALDGIRSTDTAFTVKLKDSLPVVGEYNTGADIGMGEGTSSSNRFGEIEEVKYSTKDVNYTWTWKMSRGIDRHTVNEDFDEAVLDEIEDQAKEKVRAFDSRGGSFISKNAGATIGLVDYSDAAILNLFDELAEKFTDLEVNEEGLMAWVAPKLYNKLVNHPDATVLKNSSADIGKNIVLEFKGFTIKKVPAGKFLGEPTAPEIAYVSLRGIGKQFTGIDTARTMEAFTFNGVVLQGTGKAGEYIQEENKKAVIKVIEGAIV